MDPDYNDLKFKSKVVVIEPNTKRTQELRRQQQLAEAKKREEQQKLQKEKQQNIDYLKQMREEEALRLQQEQARKEKEARDRLEELATIKTLKGKFGGMINALKMNETNLEYTIADLDLKPKQIQILASKINKNNTLKALVMSRKNLDDETCESVCLNLLQNQTLERLELEGNLLGIKTFKAICQLLTTNTSIRHLDLEGNKLATQETNQGIIQLARTLEKNESLLQLNLSDCNLDEECSAALLQLMERNNTIISLQIDQNPNMSLTDLKNIDARLIENKAAYDKRRLHEFWERRKMWNEHDLSQQLSTIRESQKVNKETIETRVAAKRLELEAKYDQEMIDKEIEQKKIIAKLAKEASKKTKKKKKPKKKD